MIATATGYVTDQNVAKIKVWSSEGWTDGSWSIDAASRSDYPSARYTSLYSVWNQSGVGTISGNDLYITIGSCPDGSFLLRTERGDKRFQLKDGRIEFAEELVGVNNARIETYESSAGLIIFTGVNALVLFGGSLLPARGRVTAQLQKDGQLAAVLMGNAVDRVWTDGAGDGYWSVPGMIFSEFYWKTEPTEPTDYKMIVRFQRRSGNTALSSFDVRMDTGQIYSPLSSIYHDVQSDRDIFDVPMRTGLEVRN